MGSLQAQRAIQTRWWHHSQVLQGQSNSGLSSERLITNRLGFNKNSLNPACGGGEEESNPVSKHSDLEAGFPHLLPHPAPATRRDVLRSTLIPLQLAGDVDDQGVTPGRPLRPEALGVVPHSLPRARQSPPCLPPPSASSVPAL